MSDNHRHTTIMLALACGFCRGLRMAAHICRVAGERDLAIKLSDLARSDVAYKLASLEETEAQVVFAAAVTDCMAPAPPKLRLVK